MVGLYISEIMLKAGGAASPNQYVEIFSTLPNYTIPSGVYLVGIEGDNNTAANAANNPGLVQDIFNLGGLATGGNGYLVLLEKGEQYLGGGFIDGHGNWLNNVGTGNGFGNGGPSSQFGTITGVHTGQAAGTLTRTGAASEVQTDMELGSASFLLIQAAGPPTTANDIDSDNDGTPDSAIYNGWNVMDSVGILDSVNGAAARRSVVRGHHVRPTTSTGTALGNTVGTIIWTATYVGRIAKNTGVTSSDWLASVPTGTSAAMSGPGAEHAVPGSGDQPHRRRELLGASETVLVNDGSDPQHSQVTQLTVVFNEMVTIASLAGAFQVVDAQGNALSINVTVTTGTPIGDTATGVTTLVITFNAEPRTR